MTALLGSLAFIIIGGIVVYYFDKWRKRGAKKKKSAKVIQLDVSESFYQN